jgi:hypothetical protein
MASDGRNTVFAGSGPGEGKNAGRYRPGLFRLRPDAAEWEAVAGGLRDNVEVRCIAQHPTDPASLYGVTRMGQVIGTVDNGVTWQDFPLPDGVSDVYAVACT